jgi:hypothetical protein
MCTTLPIFPDRTILGARLLSARCGNHRLAASMERNAEDEHAHLAFTVAQGTARCSIRFQGGVEVIPPQVIPHSGDRSTGIKITSLELKEHALIVEADVNAAQTSFDIETKWRPGSVDGGTIRQTAEHLYEVDFDRDESAPDSFGYTHRRAIVNFDHAY